MSRAQNIVSWAIRMFGSIAVNRQERAARFIEEALELVHAEDLPQTTVNAIVSRVFSRPAGEIAKEIGQAAITLECLAEVAGYCVEREADREWGRIQSIDRDEWQRRQNAKAELGIAGRAL